MSDGAASLAAVPAAGDGALPAPAIPATCGTPELAVLARVTDQTIRNYAADGMPHTKVTPERGGHEKLVFDTARALAWIKANKPVTGRGGRKPGSGRKAAWKTGGAYIGPPGADADASPLVQAARAAPEPDPEMRAALERLNDGTAAGEDLTRIAGITGHAAPSKAEVDKLEILSCTAERNRKSAEARRQLLKADEVRKTWLEELERIRVRIRALTARVQARVMATGVPAERAPTIREAIEAEVEGTLADLAA